MEWYILSFKKVLDDVARPHICSEKTVDSVSEALKKRGFPEEKRELVSEAYFWYPHPAFSNPAIVSFKVENLRCVLEVTMYDVFLHKAKNRPIRDDLPLPSVKYHLLNYCLVFTLQEQKIFLAEIQNHYQEAIALAEIENRAWNENLKGFRGNSSLTPRLTGKVPVIEG